MKQKLLVIRVLAAVCALAAMLGVVIVQNRALFGRGGEEAAQIQLDGNGTEKSPYLVTGVEDLCLLRDAVNAGNAFEGCYFLQTCDLDLEGEAPWVPIGLFGSGHYFYGIYDGGTNKIFNLNCYTEQSDTGSAANVGLFGQLGGQVRNLGIESGRVEGHCVGSIASHATGGSAAIINCYNRAGVSGDSRAGGICDNFSGGIVVNCANYGEVTAKQSAQIVSYTAASVVDVYPLENAAAASFQGSIANYTAMDGANVFEILNSGIDYLESVDAYQDYGLKRWNG